MTRGSEKVQIYVMSFMDRPLVLRLLSVHQLCLSFNLSGQIWFMLLLKKMIAWKNTWTHLKYVTLTLQTLFYFHFQNRKLSLNGWCTFWLQSKKKAIHWNCCSGKFLALTTILLFSKSVIMFKSWPKSYAICLQEDFLGFNFE